MQAHAALTGDNAGFESDLGPLAWVLDELRKSLDGATKALRRFVRDAELSRGSDLAALDGSQLRVARQQLHQAVGALEMVGQEVPAKMLRAMETLVQKFVQRPEFCSDEAALKVERASFALTDYLEGLLKGKHYSSIALFPQYRDVLGLLGESRVHPADLWTHEWRWVDVPVPADVAALTYDQARNRIDGLVLNVVKSAHKPSAQALADLSLGFAAAQQDLHPRVFWMITAAYFEVIAHGLGGSDLYAKRAASRVLLQYRTLAKGPADISEQLVQDLLFFSAQAAASAALQVPALRAVQQAFGISTPTHVDYERAQFGRFDPALLAQARKRIATATETWSALSGGDASRLKAATDQFSLVSDSVLKLHPESAGLATALTQALAATARQGGVPSAPLAMEVATSVLYLEAAYEDIDPTNDGMVQRSNRLAERLGQVINGVQPEPLDGWMEELYRRVSDRQTMGSVVDELRGSLGEVETALDTYFRQPDNTQPLQEVPARLSQMRGVFSVLGLDQAALAVLRMRDSVERCLVDTGEPSSQTTASFERLGNSLGALGFLIDMLSYQRELAKKLFVYDEALGEFRTLMGRQQPAAPAPETPPAPVQPSAPVGDSLVPPLAPPARPIAAMPDEADEDDAELRDIFLEEAREVVHNAAQCLEQLRDSPADFDQQTSLRRCFHTLKGSSRMVGLTEFGEAAWAMEQLLNAWLPQQLAVTPELRSLSGQAMDAFARWIDAVAADADGHWRAQPFRQAADLLRLNNTLTDLSRPEEAAGIAALPASAAPPEPPVPSAVAAPTQPATVPAASESLAPATPEDGADGEEDFSATQMLDFSVTQVLDPAGLPSGAGAVGPDAAEPNDATAPGQDLLELSFDDLLPVKPRADSVPAVLAEPEPVAAPAPAPQPQAADPLADLMFAGLDEPALTPDDLAGQPDPLAADPNLAEAQGAQDPLADLFVQAMPEQADLSERPTEPLSEALDDVADLDDEDDFDDQDKVIGSLRISQGLYNVYLNEADEWSRRLLTELTEWSLELPQTVPDSCVVLAHSLAGSSATVGFMDLSELARTLEHALEHSQLAGTALPEQAALFVRVAEEIRRLLHQFAAGFLKQADPALVPALKAILTLDLSESTAAAQPTVDDAPEPAPLDSVLPEAVSGPAQPCLEDEAPISAQDALDVDLFPIFEDEALELLPKLGAALRQWQQRPGDVAPRRELLRALHTLKGSARLAGALRLGEMSHRMESAAEQIDVESASPDAIAVLQTRLDQLGSAFEALRQVPVTALSLPEVASVQPAPSGVDRTGASDPAPRPMPEPLPRAANPTLRVKSQLIDRMVNQTGEVMMSRARLESRLGQLRSSMGELGGNLERLRHQLREMELQSESQMQSRLAQTKETTQAFDPLEFDRFTRVQELTRMMAESVHDVATVQRTLQQTMAGVEDDLIAQARQTRELQHDLLRTRMIEFDSLAERLHGVVRQAARDSGKSAALEIEGGSIELDRGVLERMAPVFEHLLRNSVVHGIEAVATRQAAGKPAQGEISLRIAQHGNDIEVSLRDDGAGLDLPRIRDKAIAQGKIEPTQQLSDNELAQLIFSSGLSTAAELTELAGRGVGMDVVRTEVTALGGHVDLSTQRFQGTEFKLVLPLTTAVTQMVLLRMGEVVVGVPSNLVEIVRRVTLAELDAAYAQHQIVSAGETVPFYWAGALLQVSPASTEPRGKAAVVAVFRSAGQRVAMHVDEVLGNREAVVKNLGPQLSGLPGLAGMTTLSSGAVVLIYNPVALANLYGERARAFGLDAVPASSAAAGGAAATAPATASAAVPLVLVVDDSITVRRVTQRLLKREGFRVALANDGLHALEVLQGERPAVLLTDIEMPRMDGFDLVRNIRADAQMKDMPIIMITSRIAEKHREVARALQVDHYLGKPYPEDELIALVRYYSALPASAAVDA